MSRPIKFRAWDKRKGLSAMHYLTGMLKYGPGWIDGNGYKFWELTHGDGFIKVSDDEIVLMQFTGLLDKNGKEIYTESDVIKHNDKKIIIIDSVNMGLVGVEINKNFGTVLLDRIVKNNHHAFGFEFFYRTKKYIEVIGNIYETPELLK